MNVISISNRRRAWLLQNIIRLMRELTRMYQEALNNVPVYQWKCSKCEQTVEIVRTVADYDQCPDDTESKPCKEGETHEFQKCIGSTNFRLVGGGWASSGYTK